MGLEPKDLTHYGFRTHSGGPYCTFQKWSLYIVSKSMCFIHCRASDRQFLIITFPSCAHLWLLTRLWLWLPQNATQKRWLIPTLHASALQGQGKGDTCLSTIQDILPNCWRLVACHFVKKRIAVFKQWCKRDTFWGGKLPYQVFSICGSFWHLWEMLRVANTNKN